MNNNDLTQQTTVPDTKQYENNPFFIATNGLDLLFKKAQSIGIALAIIAGLSLLSSVPSYFVPGPSGQSEPAATAASKADEANFMNTISNIPAEVWIIVALVILLILTILVLIGTVIKGVTDVTSAHIANDKTITISQALREVFANFWGYLWVQVVMSVKVFLWTLLFIIPGIVMSVRYSLAGVVYFDKKLKGNASVVESARMTKGVWLTTFASQSLLNILTLGLITSILTPGTNAVLYRQFSKLEEPKPRAHVLSWLTLIIPVILTILVLLLILLTIAAFANYVQTT